MIEMEMAMVDLDLSDKAFFTPEQQAHARLRTLETPRGRLLIAGCGERFLKSPYKTAIFPCGHTIASNPNPTLLNAIKR